MATIVTRSGKGSPLTNNEVDANFTNLNTELGTKANTSSLATVATTGAYADLTGKPTTVDASNVAITGGSITGTTIDSITNHVGADHIHYKIKATQILAKGDVVKVVGFNAGENAFEVAKVSASTDIAVGVVYSALASGALGSIINTGLLEGIDTSAYAIGTTLYPNTSGGFTSTKPTSGRYQALAFVVRSNANNGTILIEASEPQATSLSQFTNDSGYITGITSGNVTTALGYTPANRAGDTFTGPITVNSGANQVILGSDGAIELTRGAGGAYFDFKNSTAEDFDVRLQASGNQLNISAAGGLTLNGAGVLTGITSGQVTTALGYTPYNATNPAGYITSAGSISGNAATATNISNTGTVTLASATESNSIYATAPSYTADQPTKLLNFDWYGNVFSLGNIRSGSTPSSGFGVYYTPSGGSRAELMRVDTSGNVLINRTSASGIGKLNVEGGVDVTSGNITVQAGYGIAWRGDQSRIMTPDDNSYGALIRWGATGGCRLFESTTERLRIDGTGSVRAFVDFRAPIFYDSNNTAYYVDAASTSSLSSLLVGDSGSTLAYNAAATGKLYFGSTQGDSSTNYHITTNMENVGGNYSKLDFKWYTGQRFYTHYAYGGVRFKEITTGNTLFSVGEGDLRVRAYDSFSAPIFYDSDNTGYYVDPASGTNLYGPFVTSGGTAMTAGWNRTAMLAATFPVLVFNSANAKYSGIGVDYSSTSAGMLFWVNGSSSDISGTGTVALSINTGNYVVANDVRSTIFYDSNNSAYYVDPHSTSVLLNLNLNGGLTTNGSITVGNGAASSDIYMADSDEGTRRIHCNSNRIGFLTQAEGWGSYCSDNGDWTTEATGYASSSFRAPVFYDNDDTAYYINAASTSNLNKLSASGRSMVGSAQISMAGLDANTWYPVTIPIPVARQTTLRIENGLNSNAPSWSTHPSGFSCYIEWTTNGLGWGTIGLSRRITDWREQFTSVQIVGGIDQMTFSSQEVIWLRGGANYFFSADCDVTPTVRTTSYDAYGQVVAPRSTVFNDPWETAVGKMSYGTFQANVRVTAGADIRAPIFYDSNNTGYFLDATAAGLALRTYGYWQQDSSSWAGDINGKIQYHDNSWYFSAANQWVFRASSGAEPFRVTQGGVAIASADFRAPLFYDNNDTAYFIDPNSTSRLSVANVNFLTLLNDEGLNVKGIRGQFAAGSDGQGISLFSNVDIGYPSGWGSGLGNTPSRGLSIYGGLRVAYSGGGFITSDTSVRSPIFYDSNDTSYYLDPNSTSVLNAIQPWGEVGMRRGDSATLLRSYNTSAGQPTQFYVNHNLGEVEIGNARGIVYAGGSYWQIANSVRAPILYDSNNTGYYVDPENTSNLVGLTVANRITGSVTGCTFTQDSQDQDNIANRTDSGFYQSSSGTAAEGWPINDSNWQHMIACTHTNDGNYFAMQLAASFFAQGLFYRSVNNSGTQAWSRVALYGNGYAAPLYASIYYDADNTGFYLDPASTSYLNTVSMGAQTWRGDITWNNAVNIMVPASAECSFDVNSGGVWQVWDLTVGAPMIKAPAGSNVEIGQAGSRGLYVYGGITASGNVTAYSDVRIKANVETIPSALDKLDLIRGVTYTRTDLEDKEQRYAGVIAQEIEEVLPEAVRDHGDIKTVDYNATIALLIQAVKELRDEVEMLRK